MKARLAFPGLGELQMDIFDYSHIEDLILEYFHRCKAHDKRLSMRYFAEAILDKHTSGYIQAVLAKKYRFSDEMTKHFIQSMGLKAESIEYFLTLTRIWDLESSFQMSEQSLIRLKENLSTKQINQLNSIVGESFDSRGAFLKALKKHLSKDWNASLQDILLNAADVNDRESELYQFYHERYQSLRQQTKKTVYESQLQCMSSWIHWVVLEIFNMKNPKELDPAWFTSQLHPLISATETEIRQCLEDLQNAELLIRTDDGYKAGTPHIEVSRQLSWLKSYHRHMLKQAYASLDAPSSERHYVGLLVPTNLEKFNAAKSELQRFKNKMIETLEDPEGDLLVSLSWQMFQVNQPHANE